MDTILLVLILLVLTMQLIFSDNINPTRSRFFEELKVKKNKKKCKHRKG